MQEFVDRIDKLAAQCRQIPNLQACRDLIRMCDAAYNTATDLSNELVDCRRRNKLSARSETLLANLEESIDNIEKMLVFARLMYPPK